MTVLHGRDRRRLQRMLLSLAGIVALALGLLGVLLPGLPTTPFILLAAACFSRASPTLHRWLLANRHLGPLVRDWERHRSLPLAVKWVSTLMMGAMVLLSVWHFTDRFVLQLCIALSGLVGAWVVWRIPTRPALHVAAGPTLAVPSAQDAGSRQDAHATPDADPVPARPLPSRRS